MNFGHSETQMTVDLDELKLLYRALHASISDFPELLDSQLFSQMQKMLQQAAFEDGVDVTDHAQWSDWLEGVLSTPEATRSSIPSSMLN